MIDPQEHWTVVGAIKAARSLIRAADDLSYAAQREVGAATRGAALSAAIAQWAVERDKQTQMLRIIELEGDDPEIGAGFEIIPAPKKSMPDKIEMAIRDRITDHVIQTLANRKMPMASLGQCDALRLALDEVLTAPNGIVTALGEICRASNPDWQEKREQAEWLTLDEVHDIAVRAYFRD